MKANGYVMVMLVREREAARWKADVPTTYLREAEASASAMSSIRQWLRRWWEERRPTRPRPELAIKP